MYKWRLSGCVLTRKQKLQNFFITCYPPWCLVKAFPSCLQQQALTESKFESKPSAKRSLEDSEQNVPPLRRLPGSR